MASRAQLFLRVGNEDLPQTVRAHLGRALRREIQQLPGIEDVEPMKQQAPAGSKASFETLLWDGLLIGLAQTTLALTVAELCNFLRRWSKRPGGQPVTIKVQEGDRIIEHEFEPLSMTPADIEELAKRLRVSLRD